VIGGANTVVNVHAPAESKDDEVKDSFYEVHI
jgi:hypothetical protein